VDLLTVVLSLGSELAGNVSSKLTDALESFDTDKVRFQHD
jgi:hypothetical protein